MLMMTLHNLHAHSGGSNGAFLVKLSDGIPHDRATIVQAFAKSFAFLIKQETATVIATLADDLNALPAGQQLAQMLLKAQRTIGGPYPSITYTPPENKVVYTIHWLGPIDALEAWQSMN